MSEYEYSSGDEESDCEESSPRKKVNKAPTKNSNLIERAKDLYGRNFEEAFLWVPTPGSIVALVLIRTSPDEYAIVYLNDGMAQVVQIVATIDLIHEHCPGVSIELFPSLMTGMGISRHDSTQSPGYDMLFDVITSERLQKNKIVAFYRDDVRCDYSPQGIKHLRGVGSELHPDFHVVDLSHIFLGDPARELRFTRDEDLRQLSQTASRHNVTHELHRSDQDEEIQQLVNSRSLSLIESLPRDSGLISQIQRGAQSADEFSEVVTAAVVQPPEMPQMSPLDLLNKLRQQVSSNDITFDEAGKIFIDSVQNIVLPPALGDARFALHSRRSAGKGSISLGDKVVELLEIQGSAAAVLPLDQLVKNMSALIHFFGEEIASNLSAVLFHDNKCSRHRQTFHSSLVAFLVVCANSENLEAASLATLVRIDSDPTLVGIALSIISQRGIKLIVSKNIGFVHEELTKAEYERVLKMALINDEYHEGIEELVEKLPLRLQALYYDVKKVISMRIRAYPEGKDFTAESMEWAPSPTMTMMTQDHQTSPSKAMTFEQIIATSVLGEEDAHKMYAALENHGGKQHSDDNDDHPTAKRVRFD